MTPPTHTYAIFDHQGRIHWLHCEVNLPNTEEVAWRAGVCKPYHPKEAVLDEIKRHKEIGYTCRPVTVCDRERLEALIESVKKLEAEMHEHEQSFSERSQGAVDMACSAVVIKYHALIDSTITERSEGEHE